MPTVAQLNQRHPSVDLDCIETCRALYEGGKRFRSKLVSFLPQRPAEPGANYELRRKEAHYQNYLGPIVDYFAAMLFTSRPQPVAKSKGQDDPVTDPGEYYNAFRDDCDRTGTDIDSFFKDRFTQAMVGGCSWLRLRQPAGSGEEPANKLEFERSKLGDAWLEALEPEAVLDWEVDDSGNLEWAITHARLQRRTGPGSGRDQITETWEFLTRDSVETFSVTYEAKKPPAPTDEVPSLGVAKHRFGIVPLMCVDLPIGLWVANRLESPQLAHFRLSNAQSWGMSRTCYAMPVYKVSDPDEFNQRMGAGYGITVKPEESVEWTAPPGDHFAALAAEVKAHKDEIFRIAHQMALGVENNAAAVGRSADSKIADAQATRVILIAFAKEVKEEMARVYNAISSARGDEYEWTVGGLDEFVTADLQGFLQALKLVKEVGGIPSEIANVQLMTKLAEGLLPELDQSTRAKMREEIERGVQDAPDEDDAEINQIVKLHAALASGNGGQKPGADRGPGGAKPKAPAGRGNGRATPPAAPTK